MKKINKVLNKRKDVIPREAIYVGRPSKWGNPFIVGVHGKQGECVNLFKKWIVTQDDLMNSLNELKSKDLVCWCAPKVCHADVLMKLANEPSDDQREV